MVSGSPPQLCVRTSLRALRHTLAALLEKLLHAAQIAHERLELGQTHLGAERYHVSGKKHKKHHQCSFYD